MAESKMPEMPGPAVPNGLVGLSRHRQPLYTADQMRAYGEACVAALKAALTDEERRHTHTITSRDSFHEMADRLAAGIAAYLGIDIGEHSSANCPWCNAIDAIDEAGVVRALGKEAVSDDELPGMWSLSDFTGGATDAQESAGRIVDIGAFGPVDGMGARHPKGSYIMLNASKGNAHDFLRISKGAAELLAAEITGILARPPREDERAGGEAYPTGSDREVLLYLMQQFDAEAWVCDRCGNEEPTANMDSANYLRRYLAAAPSRGGVDEADEVMHVIDRWCRPTAEAADAIRAALEAALGGGQRGPVAAEALIVECDDCGERFDNKLANCPSCGSFVRIVQVQP